MRTDGRESALGDEEVDGRCRGGLVQIDGDSHDVSAGRKAGDGSINAGEEGLGRHLLAAAALEKRFVAHLVPSDFQIRLADGVASHSLVIFIKKSNPCWASPTGGVDGFFVVRIHDRVHELEPFVALVIADAFEIIELGGQNPKTSGIRSYGVDFAIEIRHCGFLLLSIEYFYIVFGWV